MSFALQHNLNLIYYICVIIFDDAKGVTSVKKDNIGTALAIQYMHCDSLDSLEQRVLIQKKFYLAQSLGAKFGYQFNWYLRGPYSKDLTAVAFDVIPQGTSELVGYRLTAETAAILDKVNALGEHKPDSLTESSWLELLASLAFLHDEYGISGLNSETEVKDKLKEFKPWYSDCDVDTAWDVCQRNVHG